jgi:L-asparagine transporter-like permease
VTYRLLSWLTIGFLVALVVVLLTEYAAASGAAWTVFLLIGLAALGVRVISRRNTPGGRWR